MSSSEQAAASLLSQLALSFDGAVLGVALAYAAVRSVLKFASTSSALRKLRKAPFVKVSDLRSILAAEGSSEVSNESGPSDGKLVIVRGTVGAKSVIDGNWKSLRPNVLVSRESGDKAVVIQRTQICIYNEWKGFFGWTSDLRTIFARSWREQESTSLRTVPFILVEGGKWPPSDFIVVNMDGSRHPLPLVTVIINCSLLMRLLTHSYGHFLVTNTQLVYLTKKKFFLWERMLLLLEFAV